MEMTTADDDTTTINGTNRNTLTQRWDQLTGWKWGDEATDNAEQASTATRRTGMRPPQVGNTTAAPLGHEDGNEGTGTMGLDAPTMTG